MLDIFFEVLNYETIEQKKAYEIAGLLGELLMALSPSHVTGMVRHPTAQRGCPSLSHKFLLPLAPPTYGLPPNSIVLVCSGNMGLNLLLGQSGRDSPVGMNGELFHKPLKIYPENECWGIFYFLNNTCPL